MENRFMPKNSEWSSRSGVLLNMVNSRPPQTNTYSEDVDSLYKSPKGGHSNMARGNYPVHPEPADSSSYSGVNGNPLLGASLPSHMFMHAVNFETLRDDDITEKEVDSDPYTNQAPTIHNGSLNLSDVQADLMEQQQAMEQAKLLKRFKELREWQLQQQQMLMLQQQSQLMALKSEQNRVQEMISKQRQNQWGGKVTMAPDPSPFVSPRKRTVKPAGIAQALAGGVVNRYQQIHGVTERGDHQVQQLQAQRGLPKPQIPDTDSEGGCNTNPDLYSNPGSIDSHDSAELHPLSALPADDDDDDSDYSLGEPSHLYNNPAHLRNGTMYQPQPGIEPAQIYHSRLPGEQVHLQTAPMPRSQRSPRETTVNRLAKNEGYELEADEGIGSQSFHSSPVTAQPERPPQEHSPGVGHEARQGEDTSSRGGECHHEAEEVSFTNQDLDDRPVASAVGGKKTFEELLEEQLRAEEKKSQESPRSPEKPVKRPFLRRGQGLERFKGPPQKKKTPAPAKSSSTTNKKNEVPIKKTVTATKASVGQGSKGLKKNNNNKPASAKADTTKPDWCEGKSFKKPGLAPKTGQGLPGLAQKSLKLKPSAQKSVACDRKIDLTKQQTVTSEETDPGSKAGKSTGLEMNREVISSQPQLMQQNGLYSQVDASFLSHLEKMQENSEVEEEDLEEFEMLEHFADNASFSSNSSLVVKVLQKDRWKAAQLQGNALPAHQAPVLHTEDHRRFFAPPQAGHVQTTETTAKTAEDSSPDVVLLDTSDSESSSSDSSDTETEGNDLLSTIKQRDLQSDGMNLSSQPSVGKCDAGLQTEHVPDIHQKNAESNFYWNSKNESDSELSDISDRFSEKSDVTKSPVKRKIAGRDCSSARLAELAINSASMSEDIPGYRLPKENKMSNHDSDDEDVSPSPDREVEKSQLGKSQSVDRNTNNPSDSTGSSKKGDCGKNEAKNLCEDEFDDEEEWGEQSLKHVRHGGSSSDESEGNDTLIEDQGAGKQAKTNSGSSPRRSGATDPPSPVKPSPPPTSKLITKLFPKLRPQKPSPKQQEQQEKLQAAREAPVNDGIQSKVLRDKLAELEAEINKFRAENANLERLRKEREEGLSKLKKEIEDFEKEKNEELQRLNEFKTQEMKKLKHEKKVFEKYQKAARTMPDKKEREEIETLRSQLSDLQEELKRKESRWSSNTSRLKSRLEEIEQENSELKEEIKLLEKKRLEWLQKEQANKAAERLFSQVSAPPSRSTPVLGSATNSATNGFGFINTDSEEDVDPVRDEKKKMSRNPSHMSKSDGKKPGQVTNQKSDRPTSASHQRPKSGKPVSTNHKSDKLNSPSKSTNHKRSHSGRSTSSTRTSLTEDVPRRQITAEALPQLVSEVPSVSEFEHRVPQHSRKMAARFDVDKSSIDKSVDYEEIQHPDGKLERIFNTGAREILFSNGTRKEISSDGQSIIVSFFNGDVKQIMADQRVVYYYSEAQTTHSTYPDGLEILQFPNNQIEKHYPDGTKEITFPDQTVKYLFPSGVEESVFTDGTVIRVEKSGDKTIEFPNGQREVHTQQFKKREYPDGTVKTVFPDGRQETRYSNGRIRVKDKDGNVVMDKRS